jgi:triacylglycerol esterase/lipase EstA (alpha/beta hydrolase family)
MKKTIQKIALLITFTFSMLNVTAQDRNVAWVHGLDGNASSWQHYNQIFDNERNLNSLRTTYNTENGITNSANQVINSMNTRYGNNTNGANNPRNLGIGHSMGGLMLRDTDRITANGTKKFGGYITVTSPNYGAPISNSLIDGSVENAAENACNKLVDGPAAQLFSLPWGIVSNLATNVLCDKFIDNDLVQGLQGSPITNNDLRVGSPTINAINNYDTNLPRISIWAEENSPVHWRMISSNLYGNDTKFVNTVNTARGVYNGFYIYNTSLAVVTGVFGFWNPFAWGATALYGYRATQWKKGRNWIDDSENIWSSLIKTTRSEPQTYWVNTWIPCAYPPRIEVEQRSVKRAPDEDCGEWKWVQRTRYISVNYPSDGLLPQYTQELQGIPFGNRYKVEGANHIEVRNMTTDGNNVDETKDVFNLIFSRPFPDFFRTN